MMHNEAAASPGEPQASSTSPTTTSTRSRVPTTSTTHDDILGDEGLRDFGMGESKRWGDGDGARAAHTGAAGYGAAKAGAGNGAFGHVYQAELTAKAGAKAAGGAAKKVGAEDSNHGPALSSGFEAKGVPLTPARVAAAAAAATASAAAKRPQEELQAREKKLPTGRNRRVSTSTMNDAATVIQYQFSVNAKLRELVKMRRRVKRRLRSLVVYLVFVAAYTYSTVTSISSEDIFWFQENLKGQFTTVEFLPEHSPTFGKAFTDVATVQEWNQWLLGPFLGTAYSTGTFGGDPEDPFNLARHVLGYGRKLGGIRIGQLRTRRRNCTSQIGIPELITKTTEPFFCYGDALSKFTENHEDNATFGRGREKFTWAGWNNSDTRAERGAFLTTEILKPRYVAGHSERTHVLGKHVWSENDAAVRLWDRSLVRGV